MTDARNEFDAAIMAARTTWDAVKEHPYYSMTPDDPGYDVAEADEDRLATASIEAENVVFAMPAPDFRGIGEKLTIYLRSYPGDEVIRQIAADVERLAASQAPP